VCALPCSVSASIPPCTTVVDIEGFAASEAVGARSAEQPVLTGLAKQSVATLLTPQYIGALAAFETVRTLPALELVVSAIAKDLVRKTLNGNTMAEYAPSALGYPNVEEGPRKRMSQNGSASRYCMIPYMAAESSIVLLWAGEDIHELAVERTQLDR
jgi:hypothetical protein